MNIEDVPQAAGGFPLGGIHLAAALKETPSFWGPPTRHQHHTPRWRACIP
jgi:hypothetical protein